MASKVEHEEGEIWGIERVRRYAREHRKYAPIMYRSIIKDVKALGVRGRFLEMGAGPGFLSMMMARKFPDITVTAVDISDAMATVANEYIVAEKLGDRIDYVVGDVGDGDFMQELGKFDLVYSTFSLHHWGAPKEPLRNLWDAVKDSGILYIHDFRKQGWLNCLPLKGEGIESMKKAFTPDEIRAVLRETGITDYKIKNSFPYYLFMSVIARK